MFTNRLYGDYNKLIDNLVKMQGVKENLSYYDKTTSEAIQTVLKDFSEKKGRLGIGTLASLLEKDNKSYCKNILEDHSVFDNHNNKIFFEKTQKFGIDYVLEKMEGTNLNKIYLEKIILNLTKNTKI